MIKTIQEKYAELLVDYCLELKSNEKLYISSTFLAEPLVREVYKIALRRGAHVEMDLEFREQHKIFMDHAIDHQLDYLPTLKSKAMHEFDAYLAIKAPYNISENQNINSEKSKRRSQTLDPLNKAYFTRTADRSLKRNLCLYPTQASAQNAGMSLTDYEKFVYGACQLYLEDPIQGWLNVRTKQQAITDFVNQKEKFRFVNEKTDITFRTKNRIWINSDGQTNMPSGEIYTAPVDDSANGIVHFTFPSIYQGNVVENVTLWVENGEIVKWDATQGKHFLDHIFTIPGAKRFGEAAIGTNYNIKQITKNILFDEKIGGSFHMAIGQAYKQNNGVNQSAIHWDMISDMTNGGEIYADDQLIYKDGYFVDFDLS